MKCPLITEPIIQSIPRRELVIVQYNSRNDLPQLAVRRQQNNQIVEKKEFKADILKPNSLNIRKYVCCMINNTIFYEYKQRCIIWRIHNIFT